MVVAGCLLTPSSALAHDAPVSVPETGCYIGVHTPGVTEARALFNANAGKQHAFFGRFVTVGEYSFDTGTSTSTAAFVEDCYEHGAIPLLTRLVSKKKMTETIWRYYWDSIEACVPPARVMETMRAAGLTEVERYVELGIFSEYRAIKSGGVQK